MSNVDPKAAFDYLHSALVEYQLRFINTSLTGTGLILIVIGWVVTNNETRAFLTTHPELRLAGAVAILTTAAAYLFLAGRMFQVIRQLGVQLIALDYFPRAYYEYRVIKLRSALAVMSLPVIPCFFAAMFLMFGSR